MVAKSTLISRLDQTQEISAVLSLPLSDPLGAADFVAQVSNPRGPMYGHYLTPQEFGARYGGNEADYAALKNWATASGLSIAQESVARTSLTVRGTAAQFETLFQTRLNNYQSQRGQEFYSASVSPVVPDAIASRVVGVIGLTNSVQYAPLYLEAPSRAANVVGTGNAGGTGPAGAYAPSDLRTAYAIPKFGGDVPQTIALFEQGGFILSDIKVYLRRFKLPETPITFVPVNDYDGAPNNKSIGEVTLDIDTVIGINPKLREVLVYEDGKDPLPVALIDALEQIASDNKAQTLSISYGGPEAEQGIPTLQAINAKLMQLASEGITVCVSAGDYGAYGPNGRYVYPATLNVSDPGAQPYVTCVGGTTLFTGAKEIWLGETVWNNFAFKQQKGGWWGATGGGISSFWSLPAWQPASYVTGNGGSSSYRNIPDVAAIADPLTGVAIYIKSQGGWQSYGGTSLSSPVWAAYLSVLNSGLEYLTGARIGFFNPALYALGNGQPFNYLHDVTAVSNGNPAIFGTAGYYAGIGYDNCSGSGSIRGAEFAYRFLTSEKGGTPPGPIDDLAAKPLLNSVKLSWHAATGATGYVILVSDSNTAKTYITKDTKYTVDKIKPKTQYTADVAAVNSGGSTLTSVKFTTK
jgi:kumamolisin